MKFTILKEDSKTKTRLGKIELAHGMIKTPAFVPVGTQASVKALSPQDLRTIGVQIFFSNTYHLHLRPGEEIVSDLGGLQEFTAWKKPIMTDSGGFQVFSLGAGKTTSRNALSKIEEDGVKFKSHIDGSSKFLTPEKSMEIQHKLGADIMMAFDDCTPYPCSFDEAEKSMERTHRWAKRSLSAHRKLQKNDKTEQNLYGVVQGSVYEELRQKSAQFIDGLDTPGIAIGGVSVGESKKEMYQVINWVIPFLSRNKPRHLLGVGEIDDVFAAVEGGVDTMDCVTPTRWARNGTLLVSPEVSTVEESKTKYRLLIKNATYAKDPRPIDPLCACYVCQNFSRAYLNHLYKANEILGTYLGTYHNVSFMINLFSLIRDAIEKDRFQKLKEKWIA